MRLSSFSVNNYRSITTAREIQTHNMTVLVGKNNEGKSNILRALSLAMDIMKLYADDPRTLNFSPRFYRGRYNWERDYPISLQGKIPNGFSSVQFVFELTPQEISDIKNLTGIRLTSNIPVKVSINNTNAKIDIPKRGTAAFTDANNKQTIINYVCQRIDFNFIPAVRTEGDALNVISSLIEQELATLEDNPDYVNAIERINSLQQGVLDRIGSRIKKPIQEFLPTVTDIQIHIEKEKRRIAMRRNIEVIVNDGTPTQIQQKGDGIKSLTALAMLNINNRTDRMSVVAIEEPESHLHPESARQLYETISTLSQNHQVVLTTHSPLFINRMNLNENIIVDNGKATPVKKIKEIRDVLGTRVSDNLMNAENILLVEGEDDKIAIEKLLPQMSETVKEAIQNGTLVVDYLAGASNLSYKLTLYQNLQCKCHVLLDNDSAGKQAGEKAEKQGLLSIKNVTYTICIGSPEAEIEDCYAKDAYSSVIRDEYGVTLDVKQFRGNNKWSDRVKDCFLSQGKQWSDSVEKKVKLTVANALPNDPTAALDQHKRSSIDALVNALESLISQYASEVKVCLK